MRDKEMAWMVGIRDGEWYWYNDQGYPYGPYDTEELAQEGLDDYDRNYYD